MSRTVRSSARSLEARPSSRSPTAGRAEHQPWTGQFQPVRDPWNDGLLDWNAAERLRRAFLGNDPTSALPAWFWGALRFTAKHRELRLEPEEILSEAWIAAAENLRSRYGSRWREAGALFVELRKTRIGGRKLLSLENRAAQRSVTHHLEQDVLEEEARWRRRRGLLESRLDAAASPEELLELAQAMVKLRARVPAHHLDVLERRAQGQSHAEIARALGIRPQRARRLESRALEKARAALRSPDWAPVRGRRRAGARRASPGPRSGGAASPPAAAIP